MKNLNWEQINHDIRIGFALTADQTRLMAGDVERGEMAARAVLGVENTRYDLMCDHLDDGEMLASFDIEGSPFYGAATTCFKIISSERRLEEIDVTNDRLNGEQLLSYFLKAMPRESMGLYDVPSIFDGLDSPLPLLLAKCMAKLDLAEFIQELSDQTSDTLGFGFTPTTVAVLGQMNVRTVRNHFGPKGDKAIRSRSLGSDAYRSDLVIGDPLDSIEWLAGRRGFDPGGVSTDWMNEKMASIQSVKIASALPGVFAWTNRQTSEAISETLGWPPTKFSKWVRSVDLKQLDAAAVANAVGLDPKAYSELMSRLAPD